MKIPKSVINKIKKLDPTGIHPFFWDVKGIVVEIWRQGSTWWCKKKLPGVVRVTEKLCDDEKNIEVGLRMVADSLDPKLTEFQIFNGTSDWDHEKVLKLIDTLKERIPNLIIEQYEHTKLKKAEEVKERERRDIIPSEEETEDQVSEERHDIGGDDNPNP